MRQWQDRPWRPTLNPAHPPLSLRPAYGADAPAMATLSRELIERGLVWRYTPQRLAALIAEPETGAAVACDGSGIQGFAMMQFGDEKAHLMLMCVRAEQQRRGIGRRLIEWQLACARVAGIVSVTLELRADNAAALAFYRELGFVETSLLGGYYGGEIAARRMARALRS